MIQLLSAETRRNPYPLYASLRAESPVVHLENLDLWMLLDYESVKRALTDHEHFSANVAPTRGIDFQWLLFMDPPQHTLLRALVTRAFTPRSVADLEPRIRQISRQLLDAVIERGEMDLVADYATPLPLMVIAEMIGLPLTDWPRLKSWSEAIMNLASTIVGTDDSSRAASAAFLAADAEMSAYLPSLLAERRAAPRDDLLTRLANAEIDGEHLSERQIVRFVQLLLAAGTETTTNLIDNAVLELLTHQEQLTRFKTEPSLVVSAIEEVLRFRSPAQIMFRATKTAVTLHGRTIPPGKFVFVGIGSANRDPQQFADPERFDIAREPNPHLAFGHGIHFCLGAPLSRLEARIALPELFTRLRGLTLTSDAPWTPRQAFHVHGPARLPMRFEAAPRTPQETVRAGY